MDDVLPKITTLTKAPLPVEESRAQRLQRQQARFRDRGGIFVPSNRNTLIDILLGRNTAEKSPRKGTARGRSRSPAKNSVKRLLNDGGTSTADNAISSSKRRTSPRKKSQRTIQEEDSPEAGPSYLPTVRLAKGVNNLAVKSHKSTATAQEDEKKPSAKRRGRPPKNKVLGGGEKDLASDSPVGPISRLSKAKRPAKSRSKRAAEKSTESVSNSVNDPRDEANDAVTKPKRRGKEKAQVLTEPPTDKRSKSHSTQDYHDKILISDAESAKKHSKPPGTATMKDVRTKSSNDGQIESSFSRSMDPPQSEVVPLAPPRKDTERINRNGKGKDRQADAFIAGEDRDPEKAVRTSKKRTRVPEPPSEKPDVSSKTSNSNKRLKMASNDVQGTEPETGEDGVDVTVPVPDRVSVASKKRLREINQDDGDAKHSLARGARKPKRLKPEPPDDKPLPAEKGTESKCLNQTKSGKAVKDGRSNKTRPKKHISHAQEQSEPEPAIMVLSKSKLKGPRKSVMVRMKKPLPPIEDNEPDPIDFLS